MINQADTTKTILTQFADGPAQLEYALAGLTESDLNLSLTADSWSIRQIVHHLADGDDIWKICIKAALGNNDGLFTLQWYWDKPQMDWSENWRYASRSIESSLALLHANRQHILELIRQIPNAWEKSIRLKPPNRPEERIAVGDVIEMQARHVIEHIKDIQAIRQVHKV
jgi:DinB superfamily